jgi:hypothetical protein
VLGPRSKRSNITFATKNFKHSCKNKILHEKESSRSSNDEEDEESDEPTKEDPHAS